MSHGSGVQRTVSVEGLARVEGEGSLRVEVHDGEVTDVELVIFEPPRYFEALLVGRNFTEAPDITSRICGICPVAYQMSACNAMEDACGVVVDDRVRALAPPALLRRVDPEPRPARLFVARPGLLRLPGRGRARRHRPRRGRAWARSEACRATRSWRRWGVAPSTRSTSVSEAFTVHRRQRRSPRCASLAQEPATRRSRLSSGWLASSSPTWRASTASSLCTRRTATPSSRAARRSPTAWT